MVLEKHSHDFVDVTLDSSYFNPSFKTTSLEVYLVGFVKIDNNLKYITYLNNNKKY